jgi:outer membrane protein OmpA-like peptidoglycan-associated protein
VLPTREETEMKDRVCIALLLSTAIALPAFAQQTNSSPNAQPATTNQAATPSQSTTSSPREPLRDTRGDFWDGDEPGAAALIFHPFASKAYVRRQTAPIRDRLNELEEITAAHGNQIKDTDGRAQQGIQLVSKKTTEADQHALDASNRAQMAQQAASAVNTHLSRVDPVVQNIDHYKAGAQTEIRFHSGQSVLSKDAKDALDQMATPLKDQHGYVIEVEGFSSGQGQAAIAASRKMADSVVRYLVLNQEIPAYRIYVVGMGNAPATGEQETGAKHIRGSRVRISVLKNSLDQLASAPASGASTPPK